MTSGEVYAWLRGAFKPAPVVVLVVTVLAGAFVEPWLIVPGAIGWVLLAWAQGPAKLRRTQRHVEMGLDLRDAPPGLKRWNTVLRETLTHIQSDLRRGEGDNARILRPVGAEVEALANDIRRLIRQAYTLHRYLNSTNVPMIQARVAQLQAQVAATQDDFSRRQLEEAAEALRRQLDNCEHIRLLIGRTEATLENMQASLQSIGSSVVKLTAGDMAEATRTREESLDRLASARSTVSALEEVLRSVDSSQLTVGS